MGSPAEELRTSSGEWHCPINSVS